MFKKLVPKFFDNDKGKYVIHYENVQTYLFIENRHPNLVK